MAAANLTAQRLREILFYSPESGLFSAIAPAKATNGGAGCVDKATGYVRIRIDGDLHQAHRLAWLYVTGAWPNGVIDHINGVKSDNSIANLRDASAATNAQNIRFAQKNNFSSGYLGVTKSHCISKPWLAQITVNRRCIKIGYFATADEAHNAYLQKKRELHFGCSI